MFASNESLAPGGYILPSTLSQHYRFTISHILYWFTHLTETTEHVVERDLAQVIRVMDRYQTKPIRSPPPNIMNQPYTSPFPQSANTGTGQYYGNYTFSLEPVEELLLDFKPWLAESCCGGWAFRATLIDGNQQIVVKSWDSYKHDSSRRDNEVSIYMTIQSLWNVCVPRLIGKGEIDFCHSLFLEFVKVKSFVIMLLQ